MTILTTTKTWRRSPPAAHTTTPDLTAEEIAAVRRALTFLRVRLGSYTKLAAALGVTPKLLRRTGAKRGKPTVALALRFARLARVPIDAILLGEWPPEGTCPHCGRGAADGAFTSRVTK